MTVFLPLRILQLFFMSPNRVYTDFDIFSNLCNSLAFLSAGFVAGLSAFVCGGSLEPMPEAGKP
jgi:hypothetical protein